MSKASDQAVKDGKARLRACMDDEVTHLRLGNRGDGTTVTLIAAQYGDLHGTVCTCCPRRAS